MRRNQFLSLVCMGLIGLSALTSTLNAAGAGPGSARMTGMIQAGKTAFGDYRFGMTREQVRSVASCGPYQHVPGTGGLECPNLVLGSGKINISFVFAGDALTRIQLWFYDGPFEADAREATAAMLAYLSQRGPIHSNELKDASKPTPEAIFRALRDQNKSNRGARVQVLTVPKSTPPFVHGSVTRLGNGYYVFLFFASSGSTGRADLD